MATVNLISMVYAKAIFKSQVLGEKHFQRNKLMFWMQDLRKRRCILSHDISMAKLINVLLETNINGQFSSISIIL